MDTTTYTTATIDILVMASWLFRLRCSRIRLVSAMCGSCGIHKFATLAQVFQGQRLRCAIG
jgi:hypothetical protein